MKPMPSVWVHDKFHQVDDNDDGSNGKKGRDDNRMQDSRMCRIYRPPSPTWASRAGGVAIFRKKV